MTALLDLYLSKNRGDRKIVDSTKGVAVREKKNENKTNKIFKRKKQKETLPVAPSNHGIKRDASRPSISGELR